MDYRSCFSFSAIVGALIGVIGALIGGFIAGHYSLRAQKEAARDQRERDRQTEREVVNGTLQAMATELEVFKARFLDAFTLSFGEANSEKLPNLFSLTQSVTTVFDSNAQVLGRIADAALRRKILFVYTRLKATVGVINHYSTRRNTFESIHYQPSPGGGPNELKAEVEDWAERIRRNIPELETEIKDLLTELEKYLSRP